MINLLCRFADGYECGASGETVEAAIDAAVAHKGEDPVEVVVVGSDGTAGRPVKKAARRRR